jgi:hypothetical protein
MRARTPTLPAHARARACRPAAHRVGGAHQHLRLRGRGAQAWEGDVKHERRGGARGRRRWQQPRGVLQLGQLRQEAVRALSGRARRHGRAAQRGGRRRDLRVRAAHRESETRKRERTHRSARTSARASVYLDCARTARSAMSVSTFALFVVAAHTHSRSDSRVIPAWRKMDSVQRRSEPPTCTHLGRCTSAIDRCSLDSRCEMMSSSGWALHRRSGNRATGFSVCGGGRAQPETQHAAACACNHGSAAAHLQLCARFEHEVDGRSVRSLGRFRASIGRSASSRRRCRCALRRRGGLCHEHRMCKAQHRLLRRNRPGTARAAGGASAGGASRSAAAAVR